MTSACPDKDNSNSSPCYILYHLEPKYAGVTVWDKTARVGATTYKNCSINSYTIRYGNSSTSGACSNIGTIGIDKLSENYDYDDGDKILSSFYWRSSGYNSGRGPYANCIVELTCDSV